MAKHLCSTSPRLHRFSPNNKSQLQTIDSHLFSVDKFVSETTFHSQRSHLGFSTVLLSGCQLCSCFADGCKFSLFSIISIIATCFLNRHRVTFCVPAALRFGKIKRRDCLTNEEKGTESFYIKRNRLYLNDLNDTMRLTCFSVNLVAL